MAEWADLIQESIADIGALAAGQSISTSAQTDAFLRLQQMIDSWSIDPLLALYQVQHGTLSLTANTNTYTVGPSGSLSTSASPVRVTGVSAVSGNFRQGCRLVSFDEFAKEVSDGESTTATLPKLVAADTAYPKINLKVWRMPGTSPGSLEINYWIPMPAPVTVTDAVSLPPGFQLAIQKNLALKLYPQYARERGVDPVLVKDAADSLEYIRNVNRSMLAEGIAQQATLAPPASPQTQK